MQVIPPTQINHNNNYETFYKISPNLFTPERLDLFNSIDLYCSLINVSKNLEHGTRLNNISWRIINKALLKDHSINKSKKRDVRPIITTAELFQKYKPQPKSIGNKKEDPQNIIEGFDTSSSSIPTTTTNNETLAKPVMIKKDSLFSATDTNKNNGNIKESHSFFNNDNNNNNKIFFSSEDEYSDWNSISDDDMDYDDDDFYNENDNVIMSTNSNNTTSSRTSSRRSNRNNERIGRSQYRQGTNSNNNNINNKSENRSNKNYRARHNNRYDDEFDEDDDDEEDDQYYRNQWDKLMFTKTENFHTSRPSSMTSSTSNNNNNNHHQHNNNNNNGSMTSPDSAKKSLLTGLFSNENNSSNKPTISNHHIPRSQSSTYSINEEANKSTHNTITPIISPHLSNTNISSHNAPLEVVGKKSQPSNSTTTTQVHSRTSSFNNGISLPKKDRYLHESNAPLTAQMILPTALSTHMFLPNNIHQQRLASKKAAASANITSTTTLRRERTPSEESHSINSNAIVESSDSGGRNQKIGRRRVSMDIPSKNRNSGFLKTRMEISEEEKTVMNRARRTNK
ncbi:hypothetical protein C6P45_002177 [Maudiozyma exigua]|uniref:Nitrogen regulatory protein areA GATA-like domain-containing protein n=1 Tax=Maudiozyma exigua TaxID=34358 RepID=A0A9P6VYB9_MAUEX|nr:hypothetical protein C6P45_002177 [Kazachstania exigua]